MRAFVPNRRVVENGNGGCPGGTLVPSVDVRHYNAFAMTQHFSRLGRTPFWHLCVPKGAEMTSLRGGMLFAPLPAGFRRLLWPPLPEHYYAS